MNMQVVPNWHSWILERTFVHFWPWFRRI